MPKGCQQWVLADKPAGVRSNMRKTLDSQLCAGVLLAGSI